MKQMQYIKFLCLFVVLCIFTDVRAQLSTNEKPVSFGKESEMTVKHRSLNSIVTMPQLDMARIEKEDKADKEKGLPPRFGYRHKVNYNLNNSGTWYELPNGDKLWQLNIVCPNALSVNLCYDKFWIPEGGKMFVYSKDRRQSIGAFTSRNNKGDSLNIRGFATGLVFGNDVILEYYQPKEVVPEAVISIEYIVHGYRYVNWRSLGFMGSNGCQINVNCEEGWDWQEEKKAVAMIMKGNEIIGTGSLINTTSLSEVPLFLTANHSIIPYGNAGESDTIYSDFIFYWNYETPGCNNDSIDNYYSTSGAKILANNSPSDFALLRLVENPKNLSNYIPYYLGWDNSGNSGNPGVCIHHPMGDVKKISTVKFQPYITHYEDERENLAGSHWCVTWKTTQNGHGTVEIGSSGSPLFTAEHKVIGQLHGGYPSCEEDLKGPAWFGRFDVSWSASNDTSKYRRLNCWLDSIYNGTKTTMEGLLIIPNTKVMTTNRQLYSNIRITGTGQLTVQSNIELMGNSRVVVEGGGKLIIDGGTLSNVDIDLKVGSSLLIINGGIMETKNGFKAPVGTKVNIENGKIL